MVSVVGTDPELLQRGACRNCASILEFTQSEVQKKQGSDYAGGRFTVEWIRCPKCNAEVITKSG